ncbi:peroxisome proliferator-activated receptor gamma coactivator-related protein 1-like isoform X2 [Thunnus albacares]|uniref:peroxisome proliferator-activated receptor gamma coactivator-related protein 1-like isoform X2 n=1 Tax=Thunnus albacares TaxID=8236 RepID=UPI001CF64893|nr:peroxisome proliferator-activated receptor gamma coactivator-related protein 1-like isoform X2 [Thunnus albacares]
MWSSNMAARWRGKEGDLNAGNSDFLCSNTPDEFTLCRGDVEMDPQSCMDHSILAIFEDSTVSSEDKSGVEEENETLLSALTEMLDSVEDVNGTLSPFDTLPDTKLLTNQECRDKSAEVYLTDRLRPRSKPPNLTFTIKSDGEKEEERKVEKNSLTLFQPNDKKVENEVEVFTSTSLVNLVKIMHPYCLKLHVEEEGKGWESTARPSASSWDKLKKKHTLFSQGEVYKYERPTEDGDEEINVVSDDEAPAKETKEEEEGDEKRDDGKLLKSILLHGNSSRAPLCREKKRVSFGPVQMASLDESAGKELNEKNQTSGHTSGITVSEALENPAGSALEAQTNPSSEINSNNKAEVLPPKAETKAKSLSLQQYRQLRQKRQPLVEKQGNYITKWPSVSEPPKELTPILCLQGQRISTDHLHRPSSHRTALPSRPNPVEDKPSSRTCGSGLKCPKTESKIISPASPLPDVLANADVNVPESKKSPVKKPTLLSSDPPNPVLLPMPVTQTASPSTAHSSSKESKVELLNRDSSLETTANLQEIQNESTTSTSQTQPSSSEPKPKAMLPKQDRNLDSTVLLQEIKNKLTEIVSGISSRSPALGSTTTQTESNSECKEPQKYSPKPTKDIKLEPKIPQSPCPDPVGQTKCPSSTPYSSQPPTSLNTPTPVKETSPEVPSSISPPEEPPPSPKLGCREQSAVGESGIEAPDLTSLLEQFEETQDKEEGESESKLEPKLVSAASSPNLQTHTDLHITPPRGTEKTSKQLLPPPVEPLKPLSTSETPGTLKTIRNLPDLQMLPLADIPEPLGTEIILSTQQTQPARRKNPPSKAIQIIDPRPLPSKKTNTSTSEFPAAHTAPHLYSSVSSDHDYCAPVDHSPTSATQHSRAKPSLLKDISKTTNEVQVNTHDSCATAECRKQTSTREVTTTVRAVNCATLVMQPLSENHKTRSETNPSTDKALSSSDSAASEQDCGGASEDKTAPCTLPTPPPSPPSRGREKRRYRRRSPRSSSSSSSSSASRSPKRPRLHHKRSESSSCSSSSSRSVSRSPPRRYRLSRSRSRCSRSRSRSWSQSRSPSRSPSPRTCHTRWRDVYSRESRRLRREHEMRIQKLKAIDERRVVYVGRISRAMTHDELRERFSQFGDVECVSLHFRDRGDHYGFVTFYNMEDAFAAIDNGGKLRRPDELPFDICFGGRRQFCKSNYADLDANRDAEESPARSRFEDLDFDSLLKQAQRGLKR